MTQGIKLHERYFITSKAALEIKEALWALEKKHGLTTVELLRILTEHIQDELRYCLRAERHPDQPDKKADEE